MAGLPAERRFTIARRARQTLKSRESGTLPRPENTVRTLACLALALTTNLSVVSYAAAHELTEGGGEARLSWRLGFGGAQPVQTGYALALGYRGYGPDALAGQLLELDVSDMRAFARLAGLPLFERSYGAAQNETPAMAEPQAKPWYTRQWVWWTAGGVAATMALTGGDGSVEYNHNGNNTTNRNDGCAGVSANAGDTETPCASDTVGTQCAEGADGEVCVFCGNNGVTDGCSEWTGRPVVAVVTVDPEHRRWLDAGTGHMGDLTARDE